MIPRLKIEKESNYPSISKSELRNDLDRYVSLLLSGKPVNFNLSDLRIVNLCTLEITKRNVNYGTEIRLNIYVRVKDSLAQGFASFTLPNDFREGRAVILNKAWIPQSNISVEGVGLMKIASAILMAYGLQKYAVSKFGGILGGMVDDRKVARSRPDGVYGNNIFITTYHPRERSLITAIERVENLS